MIVENPSHITMYDNSEELIPQSEPSWYNLESAIKENTFGPLPVKRVRFNDEVLVSADTVRDPYLCERPTQANKQRSIFRKIFDIFAKGFKH